MEVESDTLISSAVSLDEIAQEYLNNASFSSKFNWIKSKNMFSGVHRSSRDGNCFYRSIGFALVTSLLSLASESQKTVISHLNNSMSLLSESGIDEDIAYEFYAPLADLVKKVMEGHAQLPAILHAFTDAETSNSIVMYLRLLTSAYLKVSYLGVLC